MILYALSCGVALTFLYYVFLKDDFTISLKSFLIFSIFATSSATYLYFERIPNFVILTVEPILTVVFLKFITKRKYYDIILLEFMIHLIFYLFEALVMLTFFTTKSFVVSAEYWIAIVAFIHLLFIPTIFIFRKRIRTFAERLIHIEKRKEGKMLIMIMMLHLYSIITKFVLDHYNSFNSNYFFNDYYLILIIVIIYLFIIFRTSLDHIHKNKKYALELFNIISKGEKKNILASTYSSVHDAKNVLQSIYFETRNCEDKYENIDSKLLTSLLRSKMDLSKKNNIELILENKTDKLIDFMDYSINELDFTIILGILIDNAVEHLKSHAELVQKIRIVINSDLNVYVSNQVDELAICNVHLFESFGYTSKEDSSNSGYGLYNANTIAKESDTKINMNIADSEVTFSIEHKKNSTK